VWLSHIPQNGFAASSAVGNILIIDPAGNPISPFQASSSPNDTIDPQWGIQFAAQKGRWSFAGAFQYVAFETVNTYTYEPANNLPLCTSQPCSVPTPGPDRLNPGQRLTQEFVNTTRLDFDLTANYAFRDVVSDRLDAYLGGGFKFIYATSSREYGNMSPFAANLNDGPKPGLYSICATSDCLLPDPNGTFADRVKEYSYFYLATLPVNMTFHPALDGKWLLSFSFAPLLGAEVRNDKDVVYALNSNGCTPAPRCPVKRLDGLAFAYGVTSDFTVRYVINETLSAYAGMRVQYIQGHDTYLAYGPIVGMSARFGAGIPAGVAGRQNAGGK
jgi:hypothetical protein